jgi:hypothetical protein
LFLCETDFKVSPNPETDQETIESQVDRQLAVLRGSLAPEPSCLRSLDLFITLRKQADENGQDLVSISAPLEIGDWAFEIRIDSEKKSV